MAVLKDTEYIQKIDGLEWYLLRIMPRSEQRAESFFLRNAIPYYLPRYSRKYVNSFTGKNGKQYRYEKKPVLVPMFPGYIFAALNLDSIGECRRDRSIISVCFHTTYTEDELIRDLNKVKEFEFLAGSNQIEIHPEFKIGMQVVVVRGPFEGWEGTIERKIDRNFLWVRASSIGYSMGIEIAAADCEEKK